MTNVNDPEPRPHTPGTPELTTDQVELWQSFVDGGWALMAQVNSTFGANGWTTTDLRILEVLASRQQFGISELATTVHMGVSTMSRQIGRLIDTGDVAVLHPDGTMQITDRSKDVIKSGGEWISSVELENVAVGCPGLAEAAAIGVPTTGTPVPMPPFTLASAASTFFFSGTARPPRRPSSAVITTLESESSMRLASESGEKPPNTTEWIAPNRAQASIA